MRPEDEEIWETQVVWHPIKTSLSCLDFPLIGVPLLWGTLRDDEELDLGAKSALLRPVGGRSASRLGTTAASGGVKGLD
jgi:hypothetical protein